MGLKVCREVVARALWFMATEPPLMIRFITGLMGANAGLGEVKHLFRVGQNRIYTPYMTVYLVISLPKLPYIHRIYMVLANPT
jgi:hypothetical protein